jgi:hypothetical protein
MMSAIRRWGFLLFKCGNSYDGGEEMSSITNASKAKGGGIRLVLEERPVKL